MIEESAQVLRSEGDYAWVATQRRSSCGSCAAKKGCGTGALSQVLGGRMQEMKVRNPIDAQAGEQVVLGIEEGALIRGSLAVYLLPLLTMLGGGLLGQALAPQWLINQELLTIIMAVLGLVAGLWWLRRFNRSASADPRYMAQILRRQSGEGLIDLTGLSANKFKDG